MGFLSIPYKSDCFDDRFIVVLNINMGFNFALDSGEFTGAVSLFLRVYVYRWLNLYYCLVIFRYGYFHMSCSHMT